MSVLVFEQKERENIDLLGYKLSELYYVYDGARDYGDEKVLCFKHSYDLDKQVYVALNVNGYTVWYRNDGDMKTERKIQDMQMKAWSAEFDREYIPLSRGVIDDDAELEVLLSFEELFSDWRDYDYELSYKLATVLHSNNFEQVTIGAGREKDTEVVVCGFKNYDSNQLLKSFLYLVFKLKTGNVDYDRHISLVPLKIMEMKDGCVVELKTIPKDETGVKNYYVIPEPDILINNYGPFDSVENLYADEELSYDGLKNCLRLLSMDGFQFRRQFVYWGHDASMCTINRAIQNWQIDKNLIAMYPIEAIVMEFVDSRTGEMAYLNIDSDSISVTIGHNSLLGRYDMEAHDWRLENPESDMEFYTGHIVLNPIQEGFLVVPFYLFKAELNKCGLIGKYSILMKLFSNRELAKYYQYLGCLHITDEEHFEKAKQILENEGYSFVNTLETESSDLAVYSNSDRSCAVYVVNNGSQYELYYVDEFMPVEYVLDSLGVKRGIDKGFMELSWL